MKLSNDGNGVTGHDEDEDEDNDERCDDVRFFSTLLFLSDSLSLSLSLCTDRIQNNPRNHVYIHEYASMIAVAVG
jgi:hypothetical protein